MKDFQKFQAQVGMDIVINLKGDIMATDSFEQLGIDTTNDFEIRKQKYDKASKTQPILAVIDDEVALEALNDNVIILEDPFRTGFECKACDGEGHTGVKCTACGGNKVVAQNVNFNVAAATLTEEELAKLPPHFADKLREKRKEQDQERIVSGGLIPCQKCVLKDKRGNAYISGFQPCSICNGIGSSIIVPEDTMRRPTSGIVKSLGPLCKFLQAGDRVVFSNMMGHAINYTHKVVLRTMREDEIMMRLHGTNPEKFQRKLS